MLRPEISLRISYVNVQGLTTGSWTACIRLLNVRFDYLFVAETWFVNHEKRTRDRCFIASTLALPRNLRGRQSGGIYLLRTYDARSRTGEVKVTQWSITFARGERSFSGVYFPPSMTDADLSLHLGSLTSTAVLGDINTRFLDPIYQDGAPGPPGRRRIFGAFLAARH